jgi:2-polyprenyl-3-methyl-5-hydroxy-6-metoxy-1,4-benzoquinol methylase
MSEQVILNDFGFYSLVEQPTFKELEEYYANKYYQSDEGPYQNSYSIQEVEYINNKITQKYQKLRQLGFIKELGSYSLLDIGCGEGFALNYFMKKGWDVTGLDYSDYGCKSINPQCSKNLKKGDIYENIEGLIKKGLTYDVIWLDNVLEHVLDPLYLLKRIHLLSSEVGVLVIEVPNDFSEIQKYLSENRHITDDYWIAVPDHISYFNYRGLINICSAADWSYGSILGDFPIDWFLFNEYSNYNLNRNVGFAAHKARVEIENILHRISVDKTNELYQKMAELGIGRQLIGIFTSKHTGNERD